MKNRNSAFVHRALYVHSKALAFHQLAVSCCQKWDAKHAVVDELKRAADSVIMNLSIGANRRSAPGQISNLDYALGSAAECGACLDISLIKQLSPKSEVLESKGKIHEVCCMVHGLRASWLSNALREEPPPWKCGGPFFAHETLDAYNQALEIVSWFEKCRLETSLPPTTWKDLDKATTAAPLNLAEGNARFSRSDQARFFDLALNATTRVEALVTTSVGKTDIPKNLANDLHPKLDRTAKLIRGLIRYAQGKR